MITKINGLKLLLNILYYPLFILKIPNQYWGQRYFRGQLLASAAHHDPYFTLHQHQPVSNAELTPHQSHHLQHPNNSENSTTSSTQDANNVIELDSEEYHLKNIRPSNSRKRFLREPIENENTPKKLNPSAASTHNLDDKSRIPQFYRSNLFSPASNRRSPVGVKNEIFIDEYFETAETIPPEEIGNHLLNVEKKEKPNILHVCNNKMLNVRSESEKLPCDCIECFPKLGSTLSQQKRLIKNRAQICGTVSGIKIEDNIATVAKREEPVAGPSGLNIRKNSSVDDDRRTMLTKLCAESSDSEDEGRIVGRYFEDRPTENVQLR